MKLYVKAVTPEQNSFVAALEMDAPFTMINVAYYLRKKFGSIQSLNKCIKGFKGPYPVMLNVYTEGDTKPIKVFTWADIIEQFKKNDAEDKRYVVSSLATKALMKDHELFYSSTTFDESKRITENTIAMRCGYSVATLRHALNVVSYFDGINSRIIHDTACNRWYLHMSNNRKSDRNKTDVFIHLITEQ
jgi:hypothetical protein